MDNSRTEAKTESISELVSVIFVEFCLFGTRIQIYNKICWLITSTLYKCPYNFTNRKLSFSQHQIAFLNHFDTVISERCYPLENDNTIIETSCRGGLNNVVWCSKPDQMHLCNFSTWSFFVTNLSEQYLLKKNFMNSQIYMDNYEKIICNHSILLYVM